ncbi:hypothetical protein D9M68_238310 [compost metagenome]
MELTEFFKEKKFAGCENIYIHPHIPSKQLSNAVGAYSVRVEPKEVVVLIDDTAFASGKDGVLICEDRLVVREMFSSARAYEYDAIESISCEGRRLYINGREAFKLNIPGKDELGAFFELLNQWVSRRGSSVQSREPRAAAPTSSKACPGMGELLYEVGRRVVSDKVYVHPHIPQKKLQSAINAYGAGLSAEDVIILVDDTAFGSAKDGILITDSSIYIKIFTESVRPYEWNSIESINIEKRTIYINGTTSGKLVQATEKDLGHFFNKIDEYISQQGSLSEPQLAPKALDQARESEIELTFNLDAVLLVEPQRTDGVMDLQESSALSEQGNNLSIAQDEAAAIATIVEAEVSANHPAEGRSSQAAVALPMTAKESKAKDKLLTYISTAIEQNKSKILPMIKERTGEASLAALRNDSNVESLAAFIYAFLPGLVRFALKEDVFTQFMLDNRNKILDRLIQNGTLKDMGGVGFLIVDPYDENDTTVSEADTPLAGGEYVLQVLRNVLESLDEDRQNYPGADIHYKLAIDNLAALIERANSLAEYTQDDVENQLAFMLSFMYGLAYQKVPEDLKSESVLEAYLSMLLETLERYERFGGRNLKETEGHAIESLAFRMSGEIPKDKLQKVVKVTIDAHRALNRAGKFTIDDIMFLLKSANNFSSQWISGVLLKKQAEDSELDRQLDDLFN